jgi:hypothetical protein
MWFTKVEGYMRNYLILFFSLLVISGCGGSGSSSGAAGSNRPTGSTIPVGAVSGTSFDGLVINGTVKVYDFTTGSKGALLAQATTDAMGLYNLSLQVESRPVLLELTGGYYREEAGSNANVSLSTNHKLIALANYTTGAGLKVAVTTYSYLAAGLAQYKISKGTAVSTAIDIANQRISSLVGVNILTTTPKEITDVANVSASLSPELRYGFLAGAISLWTYNNAPSATAAHLPPYTSIDFAQTLYQDISADGILDGFGVDTTGAKAQLSFGTVPLSVDVYRLGLGTAIVQMAGNTNNKTGLTGAQVLSFASSYIASTDAIFNNVAPTAFAASSTVINTPATNSWVTGLVNIGATAQSPFGLSKVEFLVDNAVVSTAASLLTAQSFQINATGFADGAHSISVRATDLGGFVSTATSNMSIDNTWPTATATMPYTLIQAQVMFSAMVCVTETGSGVSYINNISDGTTGTNLGNGCWSVPMPQPPKAGSSYLAMIVVRDKVGHCSQYNGASSGSNVLGTWTSRGQYSC